LSTSSTFSYSSIWHSFREKKTKKKKKEKKKKENPNFSLFLTTITPQSL